METISRATHRAFLIRCSYIEIYKELITDLLGRKTLDVHVLPAHAPDAAERADPALFAERVRRAMGAALDVPLDSRGADDARAYYCERIDGYDKSK